MSDIVHVIKAQINPNSAPTRSGQHWVNEVTKRTWLSVGSSSIDDWIFIGDTYSIPKYELITLSQEDVDNKRFLLSYNANPDYPIQLIPVGGPFQVLNEDYVIIGSAIEWTGLSLDGILTEGDQIQVFYHRGV